MLQFQVAHRPIELARGDGLPQSFRLVLVDDVVVAIADFYGSTISANRSRDIAARDPGVAEAALGVDGLDLQVGRLDLPIGGLWLNLH